MFIFTYLLFGVLLIIFVQILLKLKKRWAPTPDDHQKLQQIKIMIVLGSGGHTTEMLAIIKRLDVDVYSSKCYIVAENDQTSIEKVLNMENQLKTSSVQVKKIARCRQVQQGFVSSIFTTFTSIISTIPIVYRFRPDVVLCNGPGTCVPVCIIAYILRFIGRHCKIVFVESLCRVKTVSLSGKILLYFCDLFVVQWPTLNGYGSRARFLGRIS